MIHEVSGDILLSEAAVIVQGVAPNDPMDHGLALALHKRYPTMHKDFHHWCRQRHPQPGTAWLWGSVDGVRVINLLTQESAYGHGARPGKASLSHVSHALRALRKLIDDEGFKSVALPRLATGVGGLDWADVAPLIDKHLSDAAATVFVYTTYHPDQKAKESLPV